MLVLDCITQEEVDVIDYSLRVEVLPHDDDFTKLTDGPAYFYVVCANTYSKYFSRVILETFSFPEDAFAYIDYLKKAEKHSDVGDQPGGDSDAG